MQPQGVYTQRLRVRKALPQGRGSQREAGALWEATEKPSGLARGREQPVQRHRCGKAE